MPSRRSLVPLADINRTFRGVRNLDTYNSILFLYLRQRTTLFEGTARYKSGRSQSFDSLPTYAVTAPRNTDNGTPYLDRINVLPADLLVVTIPPTIPTMCQIFFDCCALLVQFRFSSIRETQCPRDRGCHVSRIASESFDDCEE